MKLIKLDGMWKPVSINERRHLCDVCNHMSYTWKEFDIHKKTHGEKEHLKALWDGVDKAYRWSMDRDSPT
jgi:hypothetical protein